MTQLAEIQAFTTPEQGYLLDQETLAWIEKLQKRPHVLVELDWVWKAKDLKMDCVFAPTQVRVLLQGLAEIVAEKQVRGWKNDLLGIRDILGRGVQSTKEEILGIPVAEIEADAREVMPFKQKTQTIEETLEPLKEEFVRQHVAETREKIEDCRKRVRAGHEAEDNFALALSKIPAFAKHTHPAHGAPEDPADHKPGDVRLRLYGRDLQYFLRDLIRTEEAAANYGHLFRMYVPVKESARKAAGFLDRCGAWHGEPEEGRLEKMALRAWIGRLETLQKAIVRKGLDGSTARVIYFQQDGRDYVLEIRDDQGRQCHARTILAGGPQVRLHLRFICT
jgi:hypothetical protein